jgi:hypothetical protein
VAESVRTPSAETLGAAQAVSRRVNARTAQVRRGFVERTDHTTGAPTPLALMLRGGRGGQVRLKLYLSLLWFAAAYPYDVTYPARAWAALLDLPDVEGAGARRINQAFGWLEKHDFIAVQARPGHPSRVTLLSDLGGGGEYSVPGAEYNKLRGAPAPVRDQHRYIQLPATAWTSGWIATLSGPGLAMLLVLLTELGPRDADSTDLWFSPRVADMKYALSEDTRTAGIRELTNAGLVLVRRRPVSTDPFEMRRRRNVYRLRLDRLGSPARVLLPSPDADTDAVGEEGPDAGAGEGLLT